MAKRKRETISGPQNGQKSLSKKAKAEESVTAKPSLSADAPLTLQIVAGSYDRVLHGITATIGRGSDASPSSNSQVSCKFADTFLFNAHTSCHQMPLPSLRRLRHPRAKHRRLSWLRGVPTSASTYTICQPTPSAKSTDEQKLLSAIAPRPILENQNNRELGNLLHHNSNITRLAFPTRSSSWLPQRIALYR